MIDIRINTGFKGWGKSCSFILFLLLLLLFFLMVSVFLTIGGGINPNILLY